MPVRRARSIPHLALLGAILYAAVICLIPVFHHDFDCHAKSPAHCPACVASPAAVDGEHKTPLAVPLLLAADEPAPARATAAAPPLVGGLKDRSPPA